MEGMEFFIEAPYGDSRNDRKSSVSPVVKVSGNFMCESAAFNGPHCEVQCSGCAPKDDSQRKRLPKASLKNRNKK